MKRLSTPGRYPLRWSFALIVCLTVIALAWSAQKRLTIETNIIDALPGSDPVIADARYVISHHPLQDRIVADIRCRPHDMERLMEGAAMVEQKLRESNLFRQVGMDEQFRLYPELMTVIAEHLPVLFTAHALNEQIKPLLDSQNIRATLQDQVNQLLNMEGIGQADLMARDPFSLRNIVLARMAPLAPGKGVRIIKGRLVSADGRHILLIAEPASQAMASPFAHQATRLFKDIAADLEKTGKAKGVSFALTPMGGYRAALDNETAAKSDTRRAVLFSTMAVLLLLMVGFPRPFIGILALLPALAGTIAALFVYSLFQKSISMLAVGFGGAIISFTVDYGIAYLLFLDRPYETRGGDASREVWTLGLLAMLTTAVSFAFLFLSGFPALAQIGVFAALGVLFTFVFVHAVYPFVFPEMPSARREGYAPFLKAVRIVTSAKMPAKAWAALALFAVMLFFAKPVFHVNLSAMNSLSSETKAAEELIRSVWGDVLSRIYVVLEGKTMEDLREKGDRLTALLEDDMTKGVISAAFLPPMVFPGRERADENFTAWQTFWTPERVIKLEKNLSAAAHEAGFAPGAFAPFYALIKAKEAAAPEMPRAFYPLMGIAQNPDSGGWRMFATLTSGPQYKSESFYRHLAAEGSAKLFDPAFFGERLGGIIMHGFIVVTLIVSLLTVLVVFLYLLDIPLTLTALAPTVFALVCTLGTLNLLGAPLGIPTIMISAIVIGMGTDYALYLIVSWQRYRDDNHPSLILIRTSISLSFATTFLGFGVLSLATHTMLKSVGLTLLLGIGYSFLGAILIVPPIAQRLFAERPWPLGNLKAGSKEHVGRVLARYSRMSAYTRLFARFKIRLDPMFPRLAEFVRSPRIILDIGCGFGIPATWLLALYPEAKVFGIDPDRRRISFAARAVGDRGIMQTGRAPDIPDIPEKADTALILDIIHMLSDEELKLTLERLRDRMLPGGKSLLILRCTVKQTEQPSFERWLETTRLRVNGVKARFRSADEVSLALMQAGFRIVLKEMPFPNREHVWFIAEPMD
ncbi:MAG: methyltransferase domain-containing protein [Deltaproteobacteria bacterium]|nr:methyltransferase domain-containing protein [Deltaproteobacteria bacterium]